MPDINYEFLIEEYKTLWNFYKFTFEERKIIYEWYFKVVALPITILGALQGMFQGYLLTFPDFMTLFSKFMFLLLLLIEIALFVSYVLQSASSILYLRRIIKIRTIIGEYAHLNGLDGFENMFTQGTGDSRYAYSFSDYKNTIIPIVNSAIVIGFVHLFLNSNYLNFIWILGYIFIFTLSIILHAVASYFLMNKRWTQWDMPK